MADLAQIRTQLETLMTDTVRITRPAPAAADGDPAWTTVYEGPGALLSNHGQKIVTQIMGGIDWLGDAAVWYMLITPLTAPAAALGDRIQITEAGDPTAAFDGRTWHADDPTQASTVELVRITAVQEQTAALGVGV
jgi:hypothetical protein